MKPFNIVLIGCGTVGSGVAKLLLEQKKRLTQRAGRPIELRHVVVRDPNKQRDVELPPDILTTDLRRVLDDPHVDAAVEVVGGIDWAKQAIQDLLKAGKHVVTANKALLAEHGPEIFAVGREHGKTIAFEASVGRWHSHNRGVDAESFGQPDHSGPRDFERHQQFHCDRHDRKRPQL